MKKLNILAMATMMAVTATPAFSQQPDSSDENKKAFMLYGASFAIPQNGWFEIACEDMGVEALNKAVSGEAIYHDARRMDKGTDYTTAELDRTDVLVIMHVHNQNVANTTNLKDKWEDYTNISTTTDYAVGYDYVIKRYIADCEALEFNPDSKYYGVKGGKPAKIMLCTHWHDGRTTYNPAIRLLAEKWNFPLIEFDKNIGFSKDDENISDPGVPSRAMAHDTETIGNITYGWHPKRGDNSPIQRRMASIFTQKVAETYGYDFPFEVSIKPVCPIYQEGEDARLSIGFKSGKFPYSVTGHYTADGLDGTRHIVNYENLNRNLRFQIEGHDSSEDAGDISAYSTTGAETTVSVADYCAKPDYDSYVSRLNTSSNYDNDAQLQLKVASNASRKAYISFQASELMPRNAEKVILRLYYKDYVLGYFNTEISRPMEGVEIIGVEGNTNVYSSSKINWSTSESHAFEPINSYAEITTDMVDGWVGIDVTDWANQTLADLEQKHGNQNTGHLTFRLFIKNNNWNALMNFHSSEGSSELGPQLLFTKDVSTGIKDVEKNNIRISNGVVVNENNEEIAIYGIDGIKYYSGNESFNLRSLSKGFYVIKTTNNSIKFCK